MIRQGKCDQTLPSAFHLQPIYLQPIYLQPIYLQPIYLSSYQVIELLQSGTNGGKLNILNGSDIKNSSKIRNTHNEK